MFVEVMVNKCIVELGEIFSFILFMWELVYEFFNVKNIFEVFLLIV